MQHYILDKHGLLKKEDRDALVQILLKGGVVVVPTDTSYGLAARIDDRRALARVFEIKGRPEQKTVSMVVRGYAQANKYGWMHCQPTNLWRAFLPGPLTIVVESRKKLPYATRVDGTVAIRSVPTKAVNQLLRKLPVPISITSANRSGLADIYSFADFMGQYENAMLPDAFVDAGKLKKHKPSTVVKALKGKPFEIVRPGPISKKQIEQVLAKT